MIRFDVVLGITIICFLLHHGFTFIFYFVIAILSFIRDLLFSKGIPKVTAIMDAEGVTRPNIRVSSHQDLDYVLNQVVLWMFLSPQIVSYIIRDYITPWYNSLTPDDSFPMELHKLLLRVVANLVISLEFPMWIGCLFLLKCFLLSYYAKLFFDVEAETEKSVCHEEIYHLRLLSDMFLFFVTPPEEYGVPGIRYITRELLVNSVLMPMINLLSDPDFVNRTIAWFVSTLSYAFLNKSAVVTIVWISHQASQNKLNPHGRLSA
ncbi:unnamed protein product [Schistosoma margrebowiei]|uniref:Uncharacterized protein n=1 Tax=Schistosoma margrebowiei TaxID=48269 RepID=A0A183MP69_9TREM|nr:unnamed protein product [Schistosoma margrebowiei]